MSQKPQEISKISRNLGEFVRQPTTPPPPFPPLAGTHLLLITEFIQNVKHNLDSSKIWFRNFALFNFLLIHAVFVFFFTTQKLTARGTITHTNKTTKAICTLKSATVEFLKTMFLEAMVGKANGRQQAMICVNFGIPSSGHKIPENKLYHN